MDTKKKLTEEKRIMIKGNGVACMNAIVNYIDTVADKLDDLEKRFESVQKKRKSKN